MNYYFLKVITEKKIQSNEEFPKLDIYFVKLMYKLKYKSNQEKKTNLTVLLKGTNLKI